MNFCSIPVQHFEFWIAFSLYNESALRIKDDWLLLLLFFLLSRKLRHGKLGLRSHGLTGHCLHLGLKCFKYWLGDEGRAWRDANPCFSSKWMGGGGWGWGWGWLPNPPILFLAHPCLLITALKHQSPTSFIHCPLSMVLKSSFILSPLSHLSLVSVQFSTLF